MSIEIKVDNLTLEVECADCGATLSGSQHRNGIVLIDPCDDCLQKAKDEGYEAGLKEATE